VFHRSSCGQRSIGWYSTDRDPNDDKTSNSASRSADSDCCREPDSAPRMPSSGLET
jgi:hypothetical protein